MIRTTLLSLLAILMFSCSETLEQKANRIHSTIVTLDSHTDTPLNLMDSTFDMQQRHDPLVTHSKYDYPRMKEGGLDAAFFAVFVGQAARTEEGNQKVIAKAHQIMDAISREVKMNSDVVGLAVDPDDAARLKSDGKRAIYMGIENGYAIGNNISLLDEYYNLGVRYMTLCHTRNNDICDSSTDSMEFSGLSEFGYKVLDRMNDLGMLVDVSHISDSSFYDVIRATKAPVIASHSCARAICDNPRNLTDDELKALAKNGGVIQMCILSDYVKTPAPNPQRDSAMAALKQRYNNFKNLTDEQNKKVWQEWSDVDDEYPNELATVSDVVDHIDHIVEVAGIDFVGIGTDFDGGGGVKDCFDVSQMKNITIELLRRGYSEEDIAKIWSGNFMRVFREVQSLRKV
ncbi:dipeptidase [Saccharicrinis sp. FJH62]|uniref:dipeptidase n=1 Tax=Saccharicrinis sp. FJH62 TaxID=3344657 RepID=UPI0035D4FCD5